MKMMLFRALFGSAILLCMTQSQAASRRITSPRVCREYAEKLLNEASAYEKRQFKTDKTRQKIENQLYRKFEQILTGMETLGKGAVWQVRLQQLQDECHCASLEELNVGQLVAITQKIAAAMVEFEKEEGSAVADESPSMAVMTRSRAGMCADDGDSEVSGQTASVDEARAELVHVLSQLPQFMDITQDSDVPKARFVMLKALAEEALTHIDQLCDGDTSLDDEQRNALRGIHKKISNRLGNRLLSAQASAKVAVFIVQGLLQVAGALAIQVNRLALAERPELVAQRASYRKWGLCTIATAMTLSAILVAGNAAGWIDIQVIPSMTDILAALPNILAAS